MQKRLLWTQTATSIGIFLAGVVSAQIWLAAPSATAQSPQAAPTPPKAFLAADERTEPVIREILVTIKKIDQRLENIEKSVTSEKKTTEGGGSLMRPSRSK
jgi:hypothetical protein